MKRKKRSFCVHLCFGVVLEPKKDWRIHRFLLGCQSPPFHKKLTTSSTNLSIVQLQFPHLRKSQNGLSAKKTTKNNKPQQTMNPTLFFSKSSQGRIQSTLIADGGSGFFNGQPHLKISWDVTSSGWFRHVLFYSEYCSCKRWIFCMCLHIRRQPMEFISLGVTKNDNCALGSQSNPWSSQQNIHVANTTLTQLVHIALPRSQVSYPLVLCCFCQHQKPPMLIHQPVKSIPKVSAGNIFDTCSYYFSLVHALPQLPTPAAPEWKDPLHLSAASLLPRHC